MRIENCGDLRESLSRIAVLFLSGKGDHLGLISIILLSFFGGAVYGWCYFYFISAVVYYAGKWMKGAAEIEHIRAALAWSNVPIIWSIALWGVAVAVFGVELFQSDMSSVDNSGVLPQVLFIFFVLGTITIKIWGLIIFMICLRQVQNFSFFYAILNLLISGAIVFIPIAVFGLGVRMLYLLASKGIIS